MKDTQSRSRQRTPATIVVLTESSWPETKRCLDTLRPTLDIHDEVVVVVPADDAVTLAGLGQCTWARARTVPAGASTGETFAGGVAAATAALVLALAPRVLVSHRWLDVLCRALGDETVGLVGPRMAGDVNHPAQKLHEFAFLLEGQSGLNSAARARYGEHGDDVTTAPELSSLCSALRREDVPDATALREARDHGDLGRLLSDGARRRGRSRAVAQGALVHVTSPGSGRQAPPPGPRSGAGRSRRQRTSAAGDEPLLSACLIVKNEENDLPRCFASLDRLADEVVVYDTGSTDNTLALARRAGATVIEGTWDDDFARARNAALAHCRGRWILHLDADETIETDIARLRERLDSPAAPDALVVPIVNVSEGASAENATEHRNIRLFRRERGEWRGRLHEQVVERPGQPPLASALLDDVRIVHTGYSADAIARKDKQERNLRVARAGLEDDNDTSAHSLLNVARSLSFAGQPEEALESFRGAVDASTNPVQLRTAVKGVAETLVALGRPEEALPWIERLREHSDVLGIADYLEGVARLNLGDHEAALACLDRVEILEDEDWKYPEAMLDVHRGVARSAAEDWEGAAGCFLGAIRRSGSDLPIWAALVDAAHRAGQGNTEIAALVPMDRIAPVMAQLLGAVPEAADALAEALWETEPANGGLLAGAIRLAVKLPPERALEWSARLRALGLGEHCPLVAQARDFSLDPMQRVLAGALARTAFEDERSRKHMQMAAGAVRVEDFEEALLLLNEICPDLLDAFVLGAAITLERCLRLGELLHGLGATGEAVSVVRHGLDHGGGGEDLKDRAGAWLRSVDLAGAEL